VRILQAVAKVWAYAGASGAVLAGHQLDKLEEIAKHLSNIKNDSKIVVVKTSVAIDQDVQNVSSQAKKAFERTVDVVLCSAGYLEPIVPIGV
jgi:NADP-dependent 3-hydroxy acid dehydrogenase YdfG